jgi:hypothetical protein
MVEFWWGGVSAPTVVRVLERVKDDADAHKVGADTVQVPLLPEGLLNHPERHPVAEELLALLRWS